MTVGLNKINIGSGETLNKYLEKEEVITRILLVIKDIPVKVDELGGSDLTTFRFIADESVESVEIMGDTYLSSPITLGTREENSDNSIESMEVTLSNKWQIGAAILASNGQAFLGKTCCIYQWFPEHPDVAPVEVYSGIMNEIRLNSTEFRFVIVRILGDYEQEAPLMTFQVNCQYVFKGEKCGYKGTTMACGKTLNDCIALNNVRNFGGFPSVPQEFLINK